MATYVSEYDLSNFFPTIAGWQLTGNILLLETEIDRNNERHLYAMDLSELGLE